MDNEVVAKYINSAPHYSGISELKANFESNRIESNRTEPNRTESNRTELSRTNSFAF